MTTTSSAIHGFRNVQFTINGTIKSYFRVIFFFFFNYYTFFNGKYFKNRPRGYLQNTVRFVIDVLLRKPILQRLTLVSREHFATFCYKDSFLTD